LIKPGHAFVAPGGFHLEVRRDGAKYRCKVSDGPLVNRHKPSVDVLFESVAQQVGKNAVAAILTGMGADGAKGLGTIRDQGAPTIAQDEKSSVVWGMPGSAVKLNAVDTVLPLDQIAAKIIERSQE
jgi:two-component system chemotaxis response regulator CheB